MHRSDPEDEANPTPDPSPDPTRPEPEEWHRKRSLRDGTPVLLRQIRPSDRGRLAEGLRRLSAASRYLRFHSVVEELSEAQLDYLSDVDHHDHEAIVAIDLHHPERPGVGVARYIRERDEPHVAEAAITVADEYQGLGAGTMLLGALAARARENGVTVFRNYVLEGNQAMLEVFDHLGAERELEANGLWRVDLGIPEDEDDVPGSEAGQAFLEVAREERTLASLIPPIWSRLRRRREAGEDDADQGPLGSVAPGSDLDAALADELAGLRENLDDWLQARDDR